MACIVSIEQVARQFGVTLVTVKWCIGLFAIAAAVGIIAAKANADADDAFSDANASA